MELNKESKLLYIAPRCFVNSPELKYFDFDNCAVRTIGSQAFQYCSALTNTSFGNQLFFVHDRAFNQCITSSTPTTIRLPSSLTHIRGLGFSILGIPENSTLEIGTQESLSKLIFSDDPKVTMEIHQNEGAKYKTINFYSEYYNPGDEKVI
jgi:hypothetical protein